jgi:F-type H+-transporting ATPase subunit b
MVPLHLTSWLLAAESAQGGLFDLNATLPLIALQFLLLVAVLDKVFYTPLTRVIDERNDYIRTTLTNARERMAKAEELTKQYIQETGQARIKAQQLIADAEAGALKIRAQKIAEAQATAQARMEEARQEVEAEKQQALQQLEQQVDALSRQMADKLLGQVA